MCNVVQFDLTKPINLYIKDNKNILIIVIILYISSLY